MVEILAPQTVIHGLTASVPPGNFLEAQNLRLCPGPTESEPSAWALEHDNPGFQFCLHHLLVLGSWANYLTFLESHFPYLQNETDKSNQLTGLL